MSTKIAIIDYGIGNITSIQNSLNKIDVVNKVIQDPEELNNFTHIILPGVGSFKAAMTAIINKSWDCKIKENVILKKKPILGICLGMQLLFEKGYENGETDGLGLVKGEVVKINEENIKIPHLGWNNLEDSNQNSLLTNLNNFPDFYFAHSYHVLPIDEKIIISYVIYGKKIVAVVAENNIYGTQFHPEKSQDNGMKLLLNFSNL